MSGIESPEGPFAGRLLDGRSARPRSCSLVLGQGDLELRFEDGPPRVVPYGDLRSAQRVAQEAHLTLAPDRPGEPELRLEVPSSAFLDALDRRLDRAGGNARLQLQKTSRRLGLRGLLLAVVAILALSWVGYSTLLPRLHVFVPRAKEAALGEFVYEGLQTRWPVKADAEFEALAARMVEELRDRSLDVDLRVELVDTDEVNAVALPGGRILVFRGLITSAPGPDALAGVLAHEIVHAEQRHSLRSMLKALGVTQFAINAVGGGIEGFELAESMLEASSGLVILQHSRAHESEADHIAVAKLRRAGRDATGLIDFFGVIQAEEDGLLDAIPGWLSTHPATRDRIEVVRRLTAGQGETEPWISPAEWEALRARLAR